MALCITFYDYITLNPPRMSQSTVCRSHKRGMYVSLQWLVIQMQVSTFALSTADHLCKNCQGERILNANEDPEKMSLLLMLLLSMCRVTKLSNIWRPAEILQATAGSPMYSTFIWTCIANLVAKIVTLCSVLDDTVGNISIICLFYWLAGLILAFQQS